MCGIELGPGHEARDGIIEAVSIAFWVQVRDLFLGALMEVGRDSCMEVPQIFLRMVFVGVVQ